MSSRIEITAVRGAGSRTGDTVVDPLIGSVAVAVARGRTVIDAHTPRTLVTLNVPHRPGYRPGLLGEIDDPAQGGTWRGKLTAVELSDDPGQRRLWQIACPEAQRPGADG